MNTVTELRAELDRRAELAPSDAEVRSVLADRIAGHAKRRRTTALIAAAAAVVVVAGAAGIAGAVLAHRSAEPAGPTPVVPVPDVPLPPDSKLIRHSLQPVTSPVTATPPAGLTGQTWMSAPGTLAQAWINPDQDLASGGLLGSGADADAAGPEVVGYVVTDDRSDAPTVVGDSGPTAATVTRSPITLGGHAATLETAPQGTTGAFGFPAERRISWQLGDGRWIHVWGSNLPSKDALRTFAAGVTETPQILTRTIGIGLTLPGLTIDSSVNSSPVVSVVGGMVYLCPPGVDPMGEATGSASTGSGSSNPDGTSSSESESSSDPTSRCVGATVLNQPKNGFASGPTVTVTVGDTVAHVDRANSAAWANLGQGLIAAVGAPSSAHLSAADLAALVASVRLSPAVTVRPLQTPHETRGPIVATAQTAATDRSAVASSLVARERSAERSLESEARSAATSAQHAAVAALQRQVLTSYLDAVKVGDCTTADHLFVGAPSDGDLCHMAGLRLHGYRIEGKPATPSPTEADFAVTITITGGDETMPDGDLLWFFDLQRQPGGEWRITGAGSGP